MWVGHDNIECGSMTYHHTDHIILFSVRGSPTVKNSYWVHSACMPVCVLQDQVSVNLSSCRWAVELVGDGLEYLLVEPHWLRSLGLKPVVTSFWSQRLSNSGRDSKSNMEETHTNAYYSLQVLKSFDMDSVSTGPIVKLTEEIHKTCQVL